MIDTFVYFSHHLITIPPPCWIDAAHRNGVPVLGFTEWNSEDNCVVRSSSSVSVEVCVSTRCYGSSIQIEGWLVNIENPLESASAVRGVRA